MLCGAEVSEPGDLRVGMQSKWAVRAVTACGGGGTGSIANDDKAVGSHSLRYSPCRVLVALVRPVGALPGDDQITWATAMRTATGLPCVVADGYSVNRRIAPKQ
jgi:hypothetical protein